jgi:hypothetical protein
VFEQGTFVWGVTRTAWLAIIIAVAGVAYAAMTYRRVSRQATGRDRAILIALRVSAMLLVLFCLMRPALILKAAVPQQNFLGVLVDDSRSMQIPDEGDKPRGQFIKDNFSAADSPMLAALTKRFAVRQFKFATNAERVQSSAGLTFDGTSSRLGDALDRARDELSGLPLSGLLVISDGADTADTTFEESLSQLKAQGVPVFAIGVGQEHLAHDVQISRVDTPRRVLKGTALVVDVIVMQTRLRRAESAAQCRERWPSARAAGDHVAGQRRVEHVSRAVSRARCRAEDVPLSHSAAERGAGHAEQPA